MKKPKIILSLLLLCPWVASAQDVMRDVMRDELKQQMSELGKQQDKPYYMNFRVEDNTMHAITANFGAIIASTTDRSAQFMSHMRLGNPDFDSYLGAQSIMVARTVQPATIALETAGAEKSLRQAIWRDVNSRYKAGLKYYEYLKAMSGVAAKGEDKALDWTPAPVEKHYDPEFTDKQKAFDKAVWEQRLREYTAIPLRDPSMTQATASISYTLTRKYFLDTDGSEVVQNLTYCTLLIQAATTADDGMELPLFKTYFAFTPEGLPSPEQIRADMEAMTDKLIELRKAPLVQAYMGPALLAGEAAGVFFHEIFGHRVEGQSMKYNVDGQTFKKQVGQSVLPKSFSVYDDPTIKQYNGQDLNGYYQYDEQGVKGERVCITDKGVLRNFLMTRTAIDGFGKTNGHGRAQMGLDPTSRQSNLIIETSDPKTEKELRELLIAEIKKQGKEYGLFFKEVTGGFTMTYTGDTNSFQVNPLEVYKVYPDGRPDELIRGVDLIGTPLSMFSNITHAGGQSKIFTGMCGAQSGNVPVTAISPTILVNKVEVQRRADSQQIPQILPRP